MVGNASVDSEGEVRLGDWVRVRLAIGWTGRRGVRSGCGEGKPKTATPNKRTDSKRCIV